nr:hypothetical protein [Methanobacterium formicicum]
MITSLRLQVVKKHELEQIFKLGSNDGLFELSLVYFCNGYPIGEIGGTIPPFEICCDICGKEHIVTEDDIKKQLQNTVRDQIKGKRNNK